MYWAAACGGCEMSLLNTGETLLAVAERFDIVFCPCLVDAKRADLERLPDGSVDLALFNGAIRTGENEEMARLIRRKARTLVAYGSCAHEGCVPGLSNLGTRAGHFAAMYTDNPSTVNPAGVVPGVETVVPEGATLRLPAFFERVATLADVVEVDYTIPGCPPESPRVAEALAALTGDAPPPRGAVVGAGTLAVCAECPRTRTHPPLERLVRVHEIVPDEGTCLLDQGLVCMGPATRDGCGARCPRVAMPCTGCYGAAAGIGDQGAGMVSAIGALLPVGGAAGTDAAELAAGIDRILDAVPDLAGTFYLYSLAASTLGKRRP